MTQSIRSLFEAATRHVAATGLEVDLDDEAPLSGRAFAKLKKRSLLPLPGALVNFYLEEANGLCFSWGTWDGEGDAPEGPFANVEIYPADEVFFDDPEDLDDRPEWQDGYVFDGTDDPELAKKTAQSMRSWVRFIDIENGDAICLDASSKPAPVLHDQHDWFDGGDGSNGHLMAPDLFSFLRTGPVSVFKPPRPATGRMLLPRVEASTGKATSSIPVFASTLPSRKTRSAPQPAREDRRRGKYPAPHAYASERGGKTASLRR